MNLPLRSSADLRATIETRLLWDDMKKAERRKIAMLILIALIVMAAIVHFVVGVMRSNTALVAGSVMLGAVTLGMAIGQYDTYKDEHVRLRKKLESIE